MKRCSCALALVALAQVVLLTLGLSAWWAHRNNHLFGNGRWLVGKDNGKFVFYTYNFMFRPLTGGAIDLGYDQGFQELLYQHPENEERRLRALEFRTAMSGATYLWVQLQKEGPRALGIRISRNANHRSGFFEFDQRGDVLRHEPFTADLPHRKGWSTVRVERDEGFVTAYMNDIAVGTFKTSIPPVGYLGFRGCGRARSHVKLRDITMDFEQPGGSGRVWTVRESFKPLVYRKKLLVGAGFVALMVVLLRWLRTAILRGYVGREKRERFTWGDTTGFLAALVAARLLAPHPATVTFPAILAGTEVWTLICFAWGRRGEGESLSRPALPLVATYAAALALLTIFTFSRHGSWLGRRSRSIWPVLENVDASAFLLVPEATRAAEAYELDKPVRIRPGLSFFPEGAVFREQAISLDFTITQNCTFDVVLQQQSFQTRGDPGGEEMPLQRRLLRLSTRADVATGLATGRRRDPEQILPLAGEVQPDSTNHLEIVAHSKGLDVVLNGEMSSFQSFTPLGLGETGFMTYEDGVLIERLTIKPLDRGLLRSGWTPVKGMAGWLLYLVLGYGIIRAFARVSVGETFPVLLCGPYVLAFYMASALAFPPDVWAGLGLTRYIWLDLAILGAGIMAFLPLVAFAHRMRSAALLFNLLFLALLISSLPLIWDLLPLEHPVRMRFGAAGNAPAAAAGPHGGGPWYSHGRGVGANSFVWKQYFGPKKLPKAKAPGQIRVFTVGGSQAWGSGAASSFETFDALVEKRLQKKGLPVEVFNAGVNGAGIRHAAVVYREILADFEPDILVADVGLNDSASLKLMKNDDLRAAAQEVVVQEFTELADACLATGVHLVLVQEAMSMKSPLRPNGELYGAIAAVARERGFPVVDVLAVTGEKEKDQMLWWDPAHYAPAGHELLASLIEPALEAAVRGCLEQP